MRKNTPSIPSSMPMRCSLDRPILSNLGLAALVGRGAQHSLRVTAEGLKGLQRVSGGRCAGSGLAGNPTSGCEQRSKAEGTWICGGGSELITYVSWQGAVLANFEDAAFGWRARPTASSRTAKGEGEGEDAILARDRLRLQRESLVSTQNRAPYPLFSPSAIYSIR